MKKSCIFWVSILIFVLAGLFCTTLCSASILIVSPHPDDDVLMAAGIVYRAKQDNSNAVIKIVYMTNGDYTGGTAMGITREGEAVAGQSVLGIQENNLIFLGYPDAYLYTIFNDYPPTDQTDYLTTPNNSLYQTYGSRGLGGSDYHYYRFGSHALYNSYYILMDLKDIITTYNPDHIFVTCEFDSHPDHSTTYQFVQLAIAAVHSSNPNYTPTVHKTIIEWSQTAYTWPDPIDPTAYFTEPPELSTYTNLNWS